MSRVRWVWAAWAAALVLAVSFGPAMAEQRTGHRSCLRQAGLRPARALVVECRQVSLAERSPCSYRNSCAALRREIRSGCALLGSSAPAFCGNYVKRDEDDDDDDEEKDEKD